MNQVVKPGKLYRVRDNVTFYHEGTYYSGQIQKVLNPKSFLVFVTQLKKCLKVRLKEIV